MISRFDNFQSELSHTRAGDCLSLSSIHRSVLLKCSSGNLLLLEAPPLADLILRASRIPQETTIR